MLAAQQLGGRKHWKQALKLTGLQEEDYLYREYAFDASLPWDVIDVGVSREYLWNELQKARQEAPTADCSPACRRCGVCQ